MNDLPPDVIERAERRVNAVFAKIVGGVMLWIGVVFVGLFIWASYKIMSLNRTPQLGAFLVLGAFAILAVFCSMIGWRLFLNRPNRFGSLLSPLGWRILGIMFGILAVAFSTFFVVVLLRDSASTELLVTAVTSVASCAIFSHWCWSAAQQALANATRSHGAP